jgi:hypothetical protein
MTRITKNLNVASSDFSLGRISHSHYLEILQESVDNGRFLLLKNKNAHLSEINPLLLSGELSANNRNLVRRKELRRSRNPSVSKLLIDSYLLPFFTPYGILFLLLGTGGCIGKYGWAGLLALITLPAAFSVSMVLCVIVPRIAESHGKPWMPNLCEEIFISLIFFLLLNRVTEFDFLPSQEKKLFGLLCFFWLLSFVFVLVLAEKTKKEGQQL